MTEPTDFRTWCQHYDYDPSSAQRAVDYLGENVGGKSTCSPA